MNRKLDIILTMAFVILIIVEHTFFPASNGQISLVATALAAIYVSYLNYKNA